jgi:putative sterol carrier protein
MSSEQETCMAIPFPGDEWIKALMARLNASAEYQAAAQSWEGDFAFVITSVPGVPAPVQLYMDLWHGACRAAYEVRDPLAQPPEFTIEAGLPTWRKVIEGRLDPIQGLVTRQLRLAGPMVKVMRAPKAAMALVRCCTQIETHWPE